MKSKMDRRLRRNSPRNLPKERKRQPKYCEIEWHLKLLNRDSYGKKSDCLFRKERQSVQEKVRYNKCGTHTYVDCKQGGCAFKHPCTGEDGLVNH